MTYNTKQKDLILNIIKNQTHEFTIKDIYEEVKNKTGLTTIYRLINKLVNEGVVSKSIGKDNITYYQYLEKCHNHNHFYLKCSNCGNMIHTDCNISEDLELHLYKHHKFTLDRKSLILNGLCEKCSGGIK